MLILCSTFDITNRWHKQLKGKFLQGKRNRRLDHLIHTLTQDVLPYYRQKNCEQKLGFEGMNLEQKKREDIEKKGLLISKNDISVSQISSLNIINIS